MNTANLSAQSSSSSSASLIVRVQAGDAAAWERLGELYSPLVYSWVRGAGLQPTDSADVAQEVFRSVVNSINTFQQARQDATFRGWLWSITRNKIRDHLRALAQRPDAAGGSEAQLRLQELPAGLPAGGPEGSSEQLNRLGHRALELVKAEFEPTTWRAFWRAAVEGDATADIAEDLGVTKWAVYKAKTRVLRRLRQELADLQ